MHTNHLLAHSDHYTIVNKWYKNHAGIEAGLTSPTLVGYLCYLHLDLVSTSALGNNKDILPSDSKVANEIAM